MRKMDQTNLIIMITPKVKTLRGRQLASLRNMDVQPRQQGGLKRTTAGEETKETKEEIAKLYSKLRFQLSLPRIERLGGRSLGVFDPAICAVELIRKDGKFENFGYSCDGKHYLEYFEAMFLLELGRLQIEYNTMTISIELAYLLLLGEQPSLKYNKYLVYSSFSRIGYIVINHENVDYNERNETVAKVDCVWELVQSTLQQRKVSDYIRNSPFYIKSQEDMQVTKEFIINQKHHNEEETTTATIPDFDFSRKTTSSTKRKADLWQNAESKRRRVCNTTNTQSKSFVDFLQDEPEYQSFSSIFAKLDVVRLKLPTVWEMTSRHLKIDFDLHLHNNGFKKSTPKPPALRLIILAANETFPTHAEISQCHRHQRYQVPLLLISISESKQLQAFLYYFS